MLKAAGARRGFLDAHVCLCLTPVVVFFPVFLFLFCFFWRGEGSGSVGSMDWEEF